MEWLYHIFLLKEYEILYCRKKHSKVEMIKETLNFSISKNRAMLTTGNATGLRQWQ